MPITEEKVLCYTPSPGKKPTHIVKWKYDVISKAIMDVIPSKGEGILFKDLPSLALGKIGVDKMESIGSHTWYTTTVKLDLEYKGLIYRVPKSKPQRLLKK